MPVVRQCVVLAISRMHAEYFSQIRFSNRWLAAESRQVTTSMINRSEKVASIALALSYASGLWVT